MRTCIQSRSLTVVLLASFVLSVLGAAAKSSQLKPRLERTTTVADGLHLWYEIKADPEDSAKLIICGTKWDAVANAPFGFVYFSADAGRTWQNVLEDRSSAWVTEHSCATGPRHRAYFVSDAAKETELGTSPKEGTTRLFLSNDAGEHWKESATTGWTDYSTSAVSKTSGRLYTFFHTSWMARDPSRQKGNDLGVLIFSPNGGKPAGPYFNSDTSKRGYNGIYPSNAVALNSGAVIVLYYAKTQTRDGLTAELGVMRAGASEDPALTQSVIAYPSIDVMGVCSNFDNGSLAYDHLHNKLFVIYTDGCGVDARLMLAASENEGRDWSRVSVISLAKAANGRVYSPSLTAISERLLGLLWEDGPSSPRWFFSKIENGTLSDPAVFLSAGSVKPEISNDSLWTSISRSDDASASGPSKATKTSIKVNVITMWNALWRTQGTLLANGKVLAIWSSGSSDGMGLFFGVMDVDDSRSIARPSDDSTLEDVTRNVLLVYGGDRGETGQYFDQENKTLKICASLRNRGQFAIRTPIELRLEDIHSDWGPISVADATRPLKGNGADWDISDSLTGDRIPPGTSSDPFCMAFRVNTKPEKRSPIDVNLLSFSLSIFARRETHRDLSGEAVQPHR